MLCPFLDQISHSIFVFNVYLGYLMASSNNDSVPDKTVSPIFIKWPLDMSLEDDEFRAGYPFPFTSTVESNGKLIY